MIRYINCFRKKSDMSAEEFREYWCGAELCVSLKEAEQDSTIGLHQIKKKIHEFLFNHFSIQRANFQRHIATS